jgi:cytidylate kinase
MLPEIENLPPVITLSGLANSGKNSTLDALGHRFPGYALEDCSLIVRAMADERGIPFEKFVDRVTNEPGFMPDYDRQIDDRAIALMRKPPVIIAGRVQHWIARGLGIQSFNVCLDAFPHTRARRGYVKNGTPFEESHRRDANDLLRYAKWDPKLTLPAEVGSGRHQVHLRVWTEAFSIEGVAQVIADSIRAYARRETFNPYPGYA